MNEILEVVILSVAASAVLGSVMLLQKEVWLAWDCELCGTRYLSKPTFFLTRKSYETLAERTKDRYRDEEGRLLCRSCSNESDNSG